MNSIEPTISEDTIKDFVSTSDSIISNSPQMNESNTKVKLVQPFLQKVLEWELHDMELEYSVQMGGRTYHVDYALSINELPKVFVEVKGCDVSLKKNHVNQLQSYLKLQDVTWGLLTNGKEYRLYQLDMEGGQAEFHLIADPSYHELARHRQALSTISKPSIESGSAVDVVRYIRELNRAEQALETRKPEIAKAVAETVTEETTDVIYQEAEQEAKELVDRLVKGLQTDQESVIPSPGPEPGSTDPVPNGRKGPDQVQFPVIDLDEIDDDDDAHVAVYASDESGIEFLKKYTAWGFISIASEPDYFLVYLTKPHQEIRYIGVVDEVVDATKFVVDNNIPKNRYKFDERKKVVVFSELHELQEPIPVGIDSPSRMQGLLYTTLGDTKRANSTDEL